MQLNLSESARVTTAAEAMRAHLDNAKRILLDKTRRA